VVVKNVAIFCDIVSCSPYVNQRFGGTYKQSLKIRATRNKRVVGGWFLPRLIFYPADEGDTFFRNVGLHADYTALYLRRWKQSTSHFLS
jgi:hypothetical protein